MDTYTIKSLDGVLHTLNFENDFTFKTNNGDSLREITTAGVGVSVNALWSVYKHLKGGGVTEILPDHGVVTMPLSGRFTQVPMW